MSALNLVFMMMGVVIGVSVMALIAAYTIHRIKKSDLFSNPETKHFS